MGRRPDGIQLSGEPANDVAGAIQREVMGALRRNIGVTGVQVSVVVDDVLPNCECFSYGRAR